MQHEIRVIGNRGGKISQRVTLGTSLGRFSSFTVKYQPEFGGESGRTIVPSVTASREPRKWVHLMISSSVDAWK